MFFENINYFLKISIFLSPLMSLCKYNEVCILTLIRFLCDKSKLLNLAYIKQLICFGINIVNINKIMTPNIVHFMYGFFSCQNNLSHRNFKQENDVNAHCQSLLR